MLPKSSWSVWEDMVVFDLGGLTWYEGLRGVNPR